MKRTFCLPAIALLAAFALSWSAGPASGGDDLDRIGELVKQGKLEEAEKILSRVAEEDKDPQRSGPALGMLGDLKARRGDTEGAVAAYDELLKRAPNASFVHFRRGMVLSNHESRQEEALASLELARDKGCKVPDLEAQIGFVAKCLGDRAADQTSRDSYYAKACTNFDSALEKDPRSMRVLGNRADIAFNVADYPKALTMYKKVFGIAPDSDTVRCRLANTHLKMGNASEALALLEPRLDEDVPGAGPDASNDEVIQAALGCQMRANQCSVAAEAYLALGRPDDALRAIRRLRATLDGMKLPDKFGMPDSDKLRKFADSLEKAAIEAGGKSSGTPDRSR